VKLLKSTERSYVYVAVQASGHAVRRVALSPPALDSLDTCVTVYPLLYCACVVFSVSSLLDSYDTQLHALRGVDMI